VLLGFSGEWVRDTTTPETNGARIDLVFNFKVDTTAYKFTMPAGSTTISPQNNLLVTGMKNGQAWGVTIAGALSVKNNGDDFSLFFALDQQHTATGVRTTTIEIKAVFVPDDSSQLNAALDLYVGASKDASLKRVTVKGEGHVTLGNHGLDITFAYGSTQTAGHTPVVALMVATTFTWTDGKLVVAYDKADGRTSVKLSSQFKLSATLRGEAYLNVDKEGHQTGISGALGLSW
jgi:hypothetical protein